MDDLMAALDCSENNVPFAFDVRAIGMQFRVESGVIQDFFSFLSVQIFQSFLQKKDHFLQNKMLSHIPVSGITQNYLL